MKHDRIGLLYAVNGIKSAVKSERNLKIHLVMGCLAILLALVLRIHPWEWLFLILVIHIVLITELINTAVEKAVDLICQDILKDVLGKAPYSENAKLAKDIAAGAALTSAVLSVMIGLIIFLPKIVQWFL